ncbi:MAG: RsmF rRNA methyltransferase first C-terminal domain-containing protein [Erysipelotrichaceae bacterium]|nr:RsmF rRNA methyltransferase first C-terminal domain-containing protein [Erysipelotrichaceae bacterium]
MNEYFSQQMKQLLKEEYPAFEKAMQEPLFRSLRINGSKTSADELRENGFVLEKKSPFDGDSYYISSEEKMGNHPFHNGGLYYLQEPSSAMAVNALQIEQGDKVLDLCAAPGGKSTQILSRLKGKGLLVTNEISYQRSTALLSNLERWGYHNFILCNDTPEHIASSFEGFFDKVIVDAPCSGSAMFRKYPKSEEYYEEALVLMNQKRQLEILDFAQKCLRQGGVLVYSTCTFNQQEDEEVIRSFLESHKGFELEDTGITAGRTGYPLEGINHLKMRRALPMDQGEGHFVARIRKTGEQPEKRIRTSGYDRNPLVEEFLSEQIEEKITYKITKDKVYYIDFPLSEVSCKIIRNGALIGEIIKNRFEPAHHFYLLNSLTYKNSVDLDELSQAEKFMKGETLNISGNKGYVQICYRGHAIGFGKGDGRIIKNHYPKGLRLVSSVNENI